MYFNKVYPIYTTYVFYTGNHNQRYAIVMLTYYWLWVHILVSIDITQSEKIAEINNKNINQMHFQA